MQTNFGQTEQPVMQSTITFRTILKPDGSYAGVEVETQHDDASMEAVHRATDMLGVPPSTVLSHAMTERCEDSIERHKRLVGKSKLLRYFMFVTDISFEAMISGQVYAYGSLFFIEAIAQRQFFTVKAVISFAVVLIALGGIMHSAKREGKRRFM